MLRLCGTCHDETEHAETWHLTEELGWRIPKYVQDPYRIPALLNTVNYAGQHWFFLTQEGGYLWVDPDSPPALPEASWRRDPEDPLVSAASPGVVSANRLRITYAT